MMDYGLLDDTLSRGVREAEEMFEGGKDEATDDKANEDKMNEIKDKKAETVSVFKFFRTLNNSNKILLAVAFFFAVVNGMVFPSIGIVMGEVTGAYDPKNADIVDDIMLELLRSISIVGAVMWITGYIYYALF